MIDSTFFPFHLTVEFISFCTTIESAQMELQNVSRYIVESALYYTILACIISQKPLDMVQYTFCILYPRFIQAENGRTTVFPGCPLQDYGLKDNLTLCCEMYYRMVFKDNCPFSKQYLPSQYLLSQYLPSQYLPMLDKN